MKKFTSINTIFIKYNIIPRWVKAGLAGLILGLSVVIPGMGYLVFLGVVMTFKVIIDCDNYKQALFLGSLVWWGKSVVSLSFLFFTFPITAFVIDKIWHQIGLIFFSWSLSGLAMAVGGLVFGGGLFLLKQSTVKSFYWLLFIPALWLGAELISSLAYSIVTWGTASNWQIYFSMGYIGYAIVAVPGLLGFAYLGGVYSLTLVVVLLVVWWLVARDSNYQKFTYLGLLFFWLVGVIIMTQLKVDNNTEKILTIDTFFTNTNFVTESTEKKRSEVLHEAVSTAQNLRPDYIILPEDSRYLDFVYTSDNKRLSYAFFSFLNSTSTAIIIDSTSVKTSKGTQRKVLRSLVFSPEKTPVLAEKKYLTPQGEYLPYLTKYLIKATGYGENLLPTKVDMGVIGELTFPVDYSGPLVLFCFESINPLAIKSMLKKRSEKPPFIAYLVSHAWFHKTFLLTYQLDTMLRVHSVWNNLPIISAGNMAIGKTYLPNGQISTNLEIAQGEGWIIRESLW